jgi:perosamine synthetase
MNEKTEIRSKEDAFNIPLTRPYFDSEELEELKKVLDSGWVTQGPKVKELEDKITEYLGVNYVIVVTNCTSALHLALLSIGVKEGDEVLVADHTFPATGHAVLYCGAKPVFVDVDLKTYNINSELIKKKINAKTKAIIPVHTFGQTAEMDAIMEIARDHNLKVVEDAACALGAKYKNKYAGTIGDIGCFSFHARKGITTGEGGMAVTNNKNLAEKIRNLSVFGMTSAWDREKSDKFIIPEFTELGYNYKMSDITAAVGVAQLRKIDNIIERKQELAKYWEEKLQEIEFIEPPYVSENVKHIYQSYVALLDKRINRNKLIEMLMKKGIQTQIGTYASHIQPVYNSKQKCPNSLEIFNRSLALPMYYTLGEEDIYVAAALLKMTLGELV